MEWLPLKAATTTCLIVLTAAIAGCSKAPYELAPAHGVVTLDGKPLPVGTVMFSPIAQSDKNSAGAPAFGSIQSDGTFVLTTYRDGDGAVVGEHWVTINGPKDAATKLPFRRLKVPQKVRIVAGQDNHIPVSLTSQDVARFGSQD